MGESLVLAIGLVLIIEGLLPFAAPRLWRASIARMSQLSDGQIRFVALGALLAGLLLILA